MNARYVMWHNNYCTLSLNGLSCTIMVTSDCLPGLLLLLLLLLEHNDEFLWPMTGPNIQGAQYRVQYIYGYNIWNVCTCVYGHTYNTLPPRHTYIDLYISYIKTHTWFSNKFHISLFLTCNLCSSISLGPSQRSTTQEHKI